MFLSDETHATVRGAVSLSINLRSYRLRKSPGALDRLRNDAGNMLARIVSSLAGRYQAKRIKEEEKVNEASPADCSHHQYVIVGQGSRRPSYEHHLTFSGASGSSTRHQLVGTISGKYHQYPFAARELRRSLALALGKDREAETLDDID
jgi:hypothetical protein